MASPDLTGYALWSGILTDAQADAASDWLATRYHARSDDVNQPIDRAAVAKFNDLLTQLLLRVANENRRPEWNKDSFFRRFAK